MERIIEIFNGDQVIVPELEQGKFYFCEFANTFRFHIKDNIENVKAFAVEYLNRNYPDKAPFRLTRVETLKPHPGTTGLNRYVSKDEVYVCFEPLINGDWD